MTVAVVTINGKRLRWSPSTFSYENACLVANIDPSHNPSVVYHERDGERREGSLLHGRSITLSPEGDYVVNVAITSGA
jgi:hypothetical protein